MTTTGPKPGFDSISAVQDGIGLGTVQYFDIVHVITLNVWVIVTPPKDDDPDPVIRRTTYPDLATVTTDSTTLNWPDRVPVALDTGETVITNECAGTLPASFAFALISGYHNSGKSWPVIKPIARSPGSGTAVDLDLSEYVSTGTIV